MTKIITKTVMSKIATVGITVPVHSISQNRRAPNSRCTTQQSETNLPIPCSPASNTIYFTATSIFTFKARIVAAMVSNRGFEPWRKAL